MDTKIKKLAVILLCESVILALVIVIGFSVLSRQDLKYSDMDSNRLAQNHDTGLEHENMKEDAGESEPAGFDLQTGDVVGDSKENLKEDVLAAWKESAQDSIQSMSLEEKVAQLFVVTPEALTGFSSVTTAGEVTHTAIEDCPIGGFVYFDNNISSESQFIEMVQKAQMYSMDRIGLPLFICVDEEGGSVSRISGHGIADIPDITAMYHIGATGDSSQAYDTGSQIGTYLSRFQVNVNFAPVADVYSNANNTVIGKRSFGSDAELVADMVQNEVRGLKSQNIAATLKHFPGHGDTAEDSHSGGAYCYKSLDELRNCELIPFQAGIDAGADFVMVGHISLPNVLGRNTPASLSHTIITDLLRDEMGFDGIVITDALNMGAITAGYSSSEAAVLAIQAGADILLMPDDFYDAYNGVIEAVKQGKIDENRINQSLERILKLKTEIGAQGYETFMVNSIK